MVRVQWYPLRFTPIYKHYLWGGNRFGTVLGRELTPGQVYAESWEICDHRADQSVVSNGPLAGRTLHELVSEFGSEILGEAGLRAGQALPSPQFPLLLKYLDARLPLSLQVHPSDQLAARLDPPELGKTEAWVVLDAESGSVIYAGLEPGVDRATLARALREGTCQACVHRFEARPGDCLLIPAGMVHALGGGLLVAELQQASDTTYRLFDWNRLAPDGKPRQLHVEKALQAIDFTLGPGLPRRPDPPRDNDLTELLRCEQFVLLRRTLTSDKQIGGDDRFHILTVLEGGVTVEGDLAGGPLSRGRSALLPAAIGPLRLAPQPRAVLLEARSFLDPARMQPIQ